MTSARLILLNKPYLVLCEFTDSEGRPTLANYLSFPELYPAGRLDYDSEGLLVLTDAGWLQHMIAHPRYKLPKTYWVQVEDIPTDAALAQLAGGVELRDGRTRPARVERIEEPALWPRDPPIREHKNIPTSWLAITNSEGRKRQIRHMTAAVGYPTLRLIRYAVGPWRLGELQPGEWKHVACPRNRGEYLRLVEREKLPNL